MLKIPVPTAPSHEISANDNANWCNFVQPEVRDIAWVLFSPRLVENLTTSEMFLFPEKHEQLNHWLKGLDQTYPDSLPKQTGFTRLGLYCEALFQYILQHCPVLVQNVELVAHHLQVFSEGKTLGEIDFILRNTLAKSKIIHMEMTVKFYLCANCEQNNPELYQTTQQNHWYGPNANDRLDIKFNKLVNHQLPLSTTQHFQRQYPKFKTAISRNHFFSGMLFHHWSQPFKPPEYINASCLTGHWLFLTEFISLSRHKKYCWRYLPKMQWLAGTPSKDTNPAAPLEEQVFNIINHYPKGRALCFERYDKTNRLLLGRVMVVPDYWPTTNAP